MFSLRLSFCIVKGEKGEQCLQEGSTLDYQIMIVDKWKVSYVVLFSFLTKGGYLLLFQGLGAEKTNLTFCSHYNKA